MGHWGAQGTQWDTGDTEIMPFRIISVLFTLGLFFEINRNFTIAMLTLNNLKRSSESLDFFDPSKSITNINSPFIVHSPI